jgi:predicted metal-dependent peptidase
MKFKSLREIAGIPIETEITDKDTNQVEKFQIDWGAFVENTDVMINDFFHNSKYNMFDDFFHSVIWTIDDRVKTACTDGINIFMNPIFAYKLLNLGDDDYSKNPENKDYNITAVKYVCFVLIHECYHQLYRHLESEENWDKTKDKDDYIHKLANKAQDYEINRDIENQFPEFKGCTSKSNGLIDNKYKDARAWQWKDIFEYMFDNNIDPEDQDEYDSNDYGDSSDSDGESKDSDGNQTGGGNSSDKTDNGDNNNSTDSSNSEDSDSDEMNGGGNSSENNDDDNSGNNSGTSNGNGENNNGNDNQDKNNPQNGSNGNSIGNPNDKVYKVSCGGNKWDGNDIISVEDGKDICNNVEKIRPSNEYTDSPEKNAVNNIDKVRDRIGSMGTSKDGGISLSEKIDAIDKELGASVINWKDKLKRHFNNISIIHKPERKIRKSRIARDADNAYIRDAPRRQIFHQKDSANVFYLVDSSGSIGTSQFERMFIEILEIEKTITNIKKSAFTYFSTNINEDRIRLWSHKNDSNKKIMESIAFGEGDPNGGTEIVGSINQVINLSKNSNTSKYYSIDNPKTLLIVFTDAEDNLSKLNNIDSKIKKETIFVIMNFKNTLFEHVYSELMGYGIPEKNILFIEMSKC